jgi:hypothetical protein
MIASPLTCLYNIVIILKHPGNKIVGVISPMIKADTCRTYVVPNLHNAVRDGGGIVGVDAEYSR